MCVIMCKCCAECLQLLAVALMMWTGLMVVFREGGGCLEVVLKSIIELY